MTGEDGLLFRYAEPNEGRDDYKRINPWLRTMVMAAIRSAKSSSVIGGKSLAAG